MPGAEGARLAVAARGRTRKSPGSRGNRGPGRSASATLGYPARGPGAACALEVPTRTPPPQNRCHSRPRDHLLRGASHSCVGSQPGRPPIRPASTGDRRAIARVNTDPIVGQAAFPCQIVARCGPPPSLVAAGRAAHPPRARRIVAAQPSVRLAPAVEHPASAALVESSAAGRWLRFARRGWSTGRRHDLSTPSPPACRRGALPTDRAPGRRRAGRMVAGRRPMARRMAS